MPSTTRATTVSATRMLTLISLLTVSTFAQDAPSADTMEPQLRKRDLQYIGCYSSATPLQEANTWQFQSQGYCQTHCANSGVIGLTNGDTCYCGSQIPATSDKVDDSHCSIGCTGWGKSMCGGDGFWTVYTTGTEANVPVYSDNHGSPFTSVSTGKSNSPTSSAPATVVTSQVAGGSTVIITVPATSEATANPQSTSGGSHGANTAGIAAGVVVGVVALSAIIAGAYFFLRHRRHKQAEKDFRQRSQVADFMRGANERKPPGTSYSGMSDSRLDPEAGRRNSVGSLADNQDYSRRILRVANPDSS